MLARPPRHPALAGVVELVWAGPGRAPIVGAERVVPTGHVHVVWRACGTPIRLGAHGEQHERFGVVGGARSAAHVHDTPPGTRSVGVLLRVGAAPRVLGDAASAFAERHTGLDVLWGAEARLLQEALGEAQLGAAPSDEAALALVEAALVARLRPSSAPAGLDAAIARLERGGTVESAARAGGRSPRTLRLWFDEAVGIAPVTWARVRRVQRALRLALGEPDWSTVAHAAGYCDQAHLCRDVREITGVTPTTWRAAVGAEPNHIPIPVADSSKPRGAAVGILHES
jgi:AraC-like DNA-binding protein